MTEAGERALRFWRGDGDAWELAWSLERFGDVSYPRPDRALGLYEESLGGYRVNRLEHALQTATRARRDGADDDWVVAALLHDIGDGLAPQNHDRFAAEILRPFLREEVTWVVEHHAAFQMVYFAHHYGWNPNERERFKDSPYYQSCVDFCERWDQSSFDPDYEMDSLESFRPAVQRVFARKPYDPEVLRPGECLGLPGRGPS